eukprot:TRINITY_DN9573_c0_g1_i1.p1 TRINITY_DN9573_c0_g1~~TRINITY_DN9573_c0_g1_i1.p1  ORF type:complete len:325 (-),score=107.48 TRINITY_DN9573_c0_g1_i1:89-1063(-)
MEPSDFATEFPDELSNITFLTYFKSCNVYEELSSSSSFTLDSSDSSETNSPNIHKVRQDPAASTSSEEIPLNTLPLISVYLPPVPGAEKKRKSQVESDGGGGGGAGGGDGDGDVSGEVSDDGGGGDDGGGDGGGDGGNLGDLAKLPFENCSDDQYEYYSPPHVTLHGDYLKVKHVKVIIHQVRGLVGQHLQYIYIMATDWNCHVHQSPPEEPTQREGVGEDDLSVLWNFCFRIKPMMMTTTTTANTTGTTTKMVGSEFLGVLKKYGFMKLECFNGAVLVGWCLIDMGRLIPISGQNFEITRWFGMKLDGKVTGHVKVSIVTSVL